MNVVMMKGLMQWASEVVTVLSAEYNLDSSKCMSLIEEAWGSSVVNSVNSVKSKSVVSSSAKGKRLIPLPFNRETIDLNGCHGLSYNHGLFTQCCNIKLEEETYCNSCKTETETSSSGKPLCGTIEDRADPEFKDSENRKPVHYLSVLRKLRVKPEAAIEEAGKHNITIDSFHLQDLPKPVKEVKEKPVKEVKEKVIKEKPVKEVKEKVIKEKPVKEVKEKVIKEKPVKEPKPVKEKVIKEKPVKEKVIKEKPVKEKKESVGRPKSTKKAIETSAVEDLFASLVAEEMSNGSESETEVEVEVVKEVEVQVQIEEVKVVEKKQQQEKPKKADKKAELDSEKKERAAMQNEEKEQKIQQAAAAKEQKLQQAAAEKEQKLKEATAAKEQKLQQAAALKLEKESAIALEKEKKAQEIAAAKEQKLKDAAVAKLEKEQKLKETAPKKQKEGTRTIVASDPKLKVGEKVTHRDNKGVETIATVLEVKLGKSFVEYELESVEGVKFVAPEGNVMPFKEPVAPVEVTKVTVKRITIDGTEYLKSSTNMLYNPKTKEEVGIYNSETGGIDALPEESDDEEEVEDDYESEDE